MCKFKNKIISTILIFILLFSTISFADDIDDFDEINFDSKNLITDVDSTLDSSVEPSINSRTAIVLDRNSGNILFGKNQFNKVKMASTTKIMTSTIVIENCNLDDIVTISKKAAGTGGSRLGLQVNDKISVRDLLYGLMLRSGNDAAVALAEYCSGSVPEFANLMNNKALDLHLFNTHFETPHGLDNDNHYTTAYELASLTNYALKNEIFSTIVGSKTHTIIINGYSRELFNTNELLGNLNGIYGVKTGFTNGANRCLVTACKRNDLDIICIVLGADTKKFRTTDSIKLIEYTFKNYSNIDISKIINENFEHWKTENLNSFSLYKSSSNFDNLKINCNISTAIILPIKNSDISNLKVVINCSKNLKAPLTVGTEIGKLYLFNNKTILYTSNILLESPINKKNFFDYFNQIFIELKSNII